MEYISHVQDVFLSCFCAAVFLGLLLWDVWRAWKRRAHWAPGRALALSALTIQMLTLIDFSDISYISSKRERFEEVAVLVRKDQLLFDCTRLMMCVFVAYLLPSMARDNWTHVWSEMGALILSVMLRMAFEVYFVWKIDSPLYSTPNDRQFVWFIASNTTIATASLSLLLLLSCAVLAGKSISYILSLKIPWLLSCCSNLEKCENSMSENLCRSYNSHRECKNSCCSYNSHRECKNWCCSQNPEECKSTEDHVLKCWIVARISQPEYIMARSVFSSLAGMIVTIAVVVVIVKWAYLHLPLNPGILLGTTVCVESVFIIVGWIIVSFRWLTAVVYFPRNVKFLLYLEDFWTMSVAELKADWDVNLRRKKLAKESHCKGLREKKSNGEGPIRTLIIEIITALRLHSVLLPMRVWLQKLMVWVSKASWGFSQKLMGMFRPFLINTQKRLLRRSSPEATQYGKFQKTLEFIRMPGEMAQNLWIANQTAFKMTQRKMDKEGIENGKSDCSKLIELIKKKSELKDEDKDYFLEMSWKRKVISLMHCMVHLYEDTSKFDAINGATRHNIINSDIQEEVVAAYDKAFVVNDAMEACSDAWDLLDFVDSSENGRADIEFDDLRNMWQKHFENLKRLKGHIDHLLQMEEKTTCALEDWRGSEDWKGLTVHCNPYCKLYMKSHSVEESGHYLVSILAYFIDDFLYEKLEDVVKKKCNKWAKEGNDEEIYGAAFIAGKAKGLRDKIAEDKAKEKHEGLQLPDNIDEDKASLPVAEDEVRKKHEGQPDNVQVKNDKGKDTVTPSTDDGGSNNEYICIIMEEPPSLANDQWPGRPSADFVPIAQVS